MRPQRRRCVMRAGEHLSLLDASGSVGLGRWITPQHRLMNNFVCILSAPHLI